MLLHGFFVLNHNLMKQLLFALLICTGTFAQADLINFKGDIANTTADSVMVTSKSGKWHRAFALDAKGHFAGKIQQGANTFNFTVGKEKVVLWLENEFDLTITADAKNFIPTLHFEGAGAKENNFMLRMERDKTSLADKYKTAVTDEGLTNDVATMVDSWAAVLKSKELSDMFNRGMAFKIGYVDKEELADELAEEITKRSLANAKSPGFTFENFKGGTTSLKDFKGKYVYIDVWATWCGPCRKEIPFLQTVEEKYKTKNIAFVSISIDRVADHDKWKAMVEKDSLGGVQLIADKDWKSEFVKAYGIRSIPRFILIDPNGTIVNADAQRPSEPELQLLLNKLLK